MRESSERDKSGSLGPALLASLAFELELGSRRDWESIFESLEGMVKSEESAYSIIEVMVEMFPREIGKLIRSRELSTGESRKDH